MTDTPSKEGDAPARDSRADPDALSLDALFDALADRRRRYVLHCLRESRTPMALADLADEVATREQEAPISEVPAEEVKRVYVSLYHAHVPKLADASIVEYSQQRDLVALSENSERIEPLLERSTAGESSTGG